MEGFSAMDTPQVGHPEPGAPVAAVHPDPLHPRLAWMMCYRETGNVQEVCRKFGISRKTFYKWLKRYNTSKGDSGSLTDRSRRPHRFPRATPEASIKILREAKEQTGFGQRRLRVFLEQKYNISLSERTIWKILKRLEKEEAPHAQESNHLEAA
jgi:transposase